MIFTQIPEFHNSLFSELLFHYLLLILGEFYKGVMNLVLQPILGTIFIILLFIKYQYRSQYNIENVSFRQYFQEFPEYSSLEKLLD